ncbi:MAG: class I SAM-dependent methyltransferase [Verrucomicrobiaceae bacterium]|nr:MAG: class I SAM-dependent methyltransferase [Verrucomicrobiaceae bacterium]
MSYTNTDASKPSYTGFSWNGEIPERPEDPSYVSLMKLVYRASRRQPSVDRLFTSFLKYRNYLPAVAAEKVIPNFAASQVTIRDLPRGLWATPLVDTLSVVKAAQGFQSKRILEIGSYKGSTARLLAENTPDSTEIWTLDLDPNHGEAYRGLPLASRIHRIIGKVSNELIGEHGPFDLIFVDADHDYRSVFHHTAVAFQQLAPGGVILWHDYQLDNYMHGGCAVPEALYAASQKFDKAILVIEGTTLGIYSEFPGWETRSLGESKNAIEVIDPWADNKIRRI